MAAVIEPLMSGVGAPWMLYGIGAVLAIVLTLLKVPALAFALGMFIPLELNIPLVVGGAINWYVTTAVKTLHSITEAGRERYITGIRIHRRRCPDGCSQCGNALRRHQSGK